MVANIRKSMQICKQVVPKKKEIFNAFAFFWVKWVYHKLYIFQFQIFYTTWPSLLYVQQNIRVQLLNPPLHTPQPPLN